MISDDENVNQSDDKLDFVVLVWFLVGELFSHHSFTALFICIHPNPRPDLVSIMPFFDASLTQNGGRIVQFNAIIAVSAMTIDAIDTVVVAALDFVVVAVVSGSSLVVVALPSMLLVSISLPVVVSLLLVPLTVDSIDDVVSLRLLVAVVAAAVVVVGIAARSMTLVLSRTLPSTLTTTVSAVAAPALAFASPTANTVTAARAGNAVLGNERATAPLAATSAVML